MAARPKLPRRTPKTDDPHKRDAGKKISGAFTDQAFDLAAQEFVGKKVRWIAANDPVMYQKLCAMYSDPLLRNAVRAGTALAVNVLERASHILPASWNQRQIEQTLEYIPKGLESAIMQRLPRDFKPSPGDPKPSLYEAFALPWYVLLSKRSDEPLPIADVDFGKLAPPTQNQKLFRDMTHLTPDQRAQLLTFLEQTPRRYRTTAYKMLDQMSVAEMREAAEWNEEEFQNYVRLAHPRLLTTGLDEVQRLGEAAMEGLGEVIAPSDPAAQRPWTQGRAEARRKRAKKAWYKPW